MRRVVAVLEVMYEWRGMTSGAGYKETAPTHYIINAGNKSGSVLRKWIGRRGEYFDDFVVTNACPQLLSHSGEKGTPDPKWLSDNIRALRPFSLLLVCGQVAQKTYRLGDAKGARVIECPHPAARQWKKEDLLFMQDLIQNGSADLDCHFRDGSLVARHLVPF